MERVQKEAIRKDLEKKMVFLAGPRQAGKTTLAKEIAKEFTDSLYLNYDKREDQKLIQEEAWLPETELIILDEIHKMPNWKNYLKGIYDTKKEHQKFLVTGSARLEVFSEVGDSLAGRFFLHRLLPFSPAELTQLSAPYSLDQLIERGGFPEPFLTKEDVDAKRWRNQYIDSLLRIDVLDIEKIQSIRTIQLVFELLRDRVGSPISYNSIAEDVSISPHTVKKYIEILEALYVIFRVTPYSKNIARSLQKEPKIYFFDTGLVRGDKGVQFENLVALSLLKSAFARHDLLGERVALKYLRTKEKKEVDFALVQEGEVEYLIEAKLSNHTLSPHLCYFHQKYNIPSIQVVKDLDRGRVTKGIEVRPAKKFLSELYL